MLTSLLFSMSFYATAQDVSGIAYSIMLKTLLSHSVPEKSVSQIDSLSLQSTYVVLDTRTEEEYNVSHIQDAKWIGYEQFSLDSISYDKTQPILVYCSVGYRSEKIAEKLIAAGYQQVYNLYGGVFEWINQGHPVFDLQGETNQIHAYNKLWGVWLQRGKKVY